MNALPVNHIFQTPAGTARISITVELKALKAVAFTFYSFVIRIHKMLLKILCFVTYSVSVSRVVQSV
jgi:hypothetical protein